MPGDTTQGGAAGGAAGAGAGAGAGGAQGAGGAGQGGAAGAAGSAGAAGGGAAAGAAGAAAGQGAAGGAGSGSGAAKGWWEQGGAGKPELTIPKDFDEALGKMLAPEVEKFATEHKLTGEIASKVFPLTQKAVEAHDKRNAAAFEDTKKGWADALPKEYGDKFKQATQDAAEFVNRFGDKELTQAFDKYGFGNFPALFRALNKAGAFIREKLSEDSSAVGGARPGAGGAGAQGNTREAKASQFYAPRKGEAQRK